jgi:hypothetical protein
MTTDFINELHHEILGKFIALTGMTIDLRVSDSFNLCRCYVTRWKQYN